VYVARFEEHFSEFSLRVAVKCFVEECEGGAAVLAEALEILNNR